MQVSGRVVVVTGAARGIGRALAERFVSEGARAVVASDIDRELLAETAREIGAVPYAADVTSESEVNRLIAVAEARFGAIDLFCSNAGISHPGGAEIADADFDRVFDVNYRSQLYAARNLVPKMTARGEGYLLQTASAAGLLTQIGSLAYAVSKHAAVALAEWLSVAYGDQGLKVSVLCPQGVRDEALARGAWREGQLPYARRHRAVRRRGRRDRGSGSGALSDPASSRGRRVHAPQELRLRPLAAGDAPAASARAPGSQDSHEG